MTERIQRHRDTLTSQSFSKIPHRATWVTVIRVPPFIKYQSLECILVVVALALPHKPTYYSPCLNLAAFKLRVRDSMLKGRSIKAVPRLISQDGAKWSVANWVPQSWNHWWPTRVLKDWCYQNNLSLAQTCGSRIMVHSQGLEFLLIHRETRKTAYVIIFNETKCIQFRGLVCVWTLCLP